MVAELFNQTGGATLVVVLIWVAIGTIIGRLIGASKNRAGDGALLGLFLGVIGWIIIALLPSRPDPLARNGTTMRACPSCAELIQGAALACRYCGRDVPPLDPDGPQWVPDPYGQSQLRYWDGHQFTDQVAREPR